MSCAMLVKLRYKTEPVAPVIVMSPTLMAFTAKLAVPKKSRSVH